MTLRCARSLSVTSFWLALAKPPGGALAKLIESRGLAWSSSNRLLILIGPVEHFQKLNLFCVGLYFTRIIFFIFLYFYFVL